MDLKEFYEQLQRQLRLKPQVVSSTLTVLGLILLSYIAASTINASLVGMLAGPAMNGSMGNIMGRSEQFSVKNRVNFRDLRKSVVGRNVFNSSGEVPDETLKVASRQQDSTDRTFDEKAKCEKTSLDIELVGTIFMGRNGVSIATVKEKGYNIADIYKEGEPIFGNTEAVIYRILPKKVVINNNGQKECLEFPPPKPIDRGPSSSSPLVAQLTGSAGLESEDKAGDDESRGSSVVSLENGYVEEALGPGFSKILEAGRLVPHSVDGDMVGFKLVGVKPGSIWTKIGLSNGDVITQVNDISMAQPDQGFAVYQALQENRDIRIQGLGNGVKPQTIQVEIK